jgi:hypothetical protein
METPLGQTIREVYFVAMVRHSAKSDRVFRGARGASTCDIR